MKKLLSKKKKILQKHPKKASKKNSPFPIPKELRTETYWQELNKVIDPELNIGIVDLGLIYDVIIKKNTAHIKMTFTTPSCPVGPYMLHQVEDCMRLYKNIKNVEIEIIWDPPWSQNMIDPDIRELMLGF